MQLLRGCASVFRKPADLRRAGTVSRLLCTHEAHHHGAVSVHSRPSEPIQARPLWQIGGRRAEDAAPPRLYLRVMRKSDAHPCFGAPALIDELGRIATFAELKVILYVLRHTWGFQDYDAGRRITLDGFCHGSKRSDWARLDSGTHLSLNSIKAGVRAAVAHGLPVRESDGRDAARSSYVYQPRRTADQSVRVPGDAGGQPWLPDQGRNQMQRQMLMLKETISPQQTEPLLRGNCCGMRVLSERILMPRFRSGRPGRRAARQHLAVVRRARAGG